MLILEAWSEMNVISGLPKENTILCIKKLKEILFTIDIFKGDLEGLAYYEMEFINEELANSYTPPSWISKEVTSDKRYKNGSLAQFGIPKD